MTSVSYKTLDINKVSIAKPIKKNNIYQSTIGIGDKLTPFTIQTPEIYIDLDNKEFTFTMVKKGKFVSVLEELEDKVISIIYNNSTVFFNGKNFTENKIRQAFKKTFTINNDGLVTLNNIDISPYLKIYDYFNEISKAPDGKFSGTCIFQINPVQFIKSQISLSYTLRFIKLSLQKKKTTECLFDDEPSVHKEVSTDKCEEEEVKVEEVSKDKCEEEEVKVEEVSKDKCEEEEVSKDKCEEQVKVEEEVSKDKCEVKVEEENKDIIVDIKEMNTDDYSSFFEDE